MGKPMGSALDVGAGTGLLTFELAPYFKQMTALDISTKMLEVLQEKAKQKKCDVTTTTGPVEALGRFDLIFSMLAFHHIGDVPAMARQMAGHLQSWFTDFDDFDCVQIPMRKKLDAGWKSAGLEHEEEEYQLFIAS